MTLEHFDTILAFVLIITGLSLFITTLNQMVSAFLGLRGKNLQWGITTLLSNADPDLAKHADEISRQVLQHPLISDSTFSGVKSSLVGRWKLASHIQKDELTRILRLLASPTSPDSTETAPDSWSTALGRSLDQLDPQVSEDLVSVATEVKNLFPNEPDKAKKLMAPLLDNATNLTGKIDQWFDSVMARSSQRFSLYLRVWTAIFAIIIAFGLQLDALSLFTRLSSDAELRSRVVASADTINRKADEILIASTNGTSTVYVLAMRQLIASHTNELKQFTEPAGFTTLQGGKDWLSAELKTNRISPEDKWVHAYEDQIPQAPLRLAYENLNSLLADKLIFEFVPNPYPNPFYRNWSPGSRTFWGLVATAALLSLGAPFWFNVLKNFSNLRPTVANRDENQPGTDTK